MQISAQCQPEKSVQVQVGVAVEAAVRSAAAYNFPTLF